MHRYSYKMWLWDVAVGYGPDGKDRIGGFLVYGE